MLRRLLIMLAVLLAASLAAGAAAPRWEGVDTVPPTVIEAIHSVHQQQPKSVSYAVSDGFIYLNASAPVQVKVFTILGQLISQETLPAGMHRLRISARGIYLLKLGESTLRVTI